MTWWVAWRCSKKLWCESSSIRCSWPRAPSLETWTWYRILERYIAEPFKTYHLRSSHWPLCSKSMKWWRCWSRASWACEDLIHETWISNYFGVPTFVMNYPAAIKAFSTWNQFLKSRARALCRLACPEGCGEIIAGLAWGRHDALSPWCGWTWYGSYRIWIYLDLRKYGTVPTEDRYRYRTYGNPVQEQRYPWSLFHSPCCTVSNHKNMKHVAFFRILVFLLA